MEIIRSSFSHLVFLWLMAASSLISCGSSTPKRPETLRLWVDQNFTDVEFERIESALNTWNDLAQRHGLPRLFSVAGRFSEPLPAACAWDEVMRRASNGRHEMFRHPVSDIEFEEVWNVGLAGWCVNQQDIGIRTPLSEADTDEVQGVIVHELGHLLGLSDTSDITAIMHGSVGFNAIEAASTDVMLLCRQYDCLKETP